MVMISQSAFGGIAPKTSPKYLPPTGAQTALDVDVDGNSVKPLKGFGSVLAIGSPSNILPKPLPSPSARPLAFDACAGTNLVDALRQRGIKVHEQEFEVRCKAAKP